GATAVRRGRDGISAHPGGAGRGRLSRPGQRRAQPRLASRRRHGARRARLFEGGFVVNPLAQEALNAALVELQAHSGTVHVKAPDQKMLLLAAWAGPMPDP